MRYRMIEVFSAATMVGWGVSFGLISNGDITRPFQPLLDAGWTSNGLGFVLTVAGMVYIGGVFINGRWYRSPLLRTLGCVVGVSVWVTATYLLAAYALRENVMPLSIWQCALLAVMDTISLRRNARQTVEACEARRRILQGVRAT